MGITAGVMICLLYGAGQRSLGVWEGQELPHWALASAHFSCSRWTISHHIYALGKLNFMVITLKTSPRRMMHMLTPTLRRRGGAIGAVRIGLATRAQLWMPRPPGTALAIGNLVAQLTGRHFGGRRLHAQPTVWLVHCHGNYAAQHPRGFGYSIATF